MERNHLLKEGKLLNEFGNLKEAGYAFSLVKEYDRGDIKASALRIKEWDYYYFGDDNYGIALTLDDNGYMGLASCSILDFKNKTYINKANMFWFCLGKVNMPKTSVDGSIHKIGKNYDLNFINENGKRHLIGNFKNVEGKTLFVDVTLELTTPHSMVIATPFKKDKHFYYNQKINLLSLKGHFQFGDLTYYFKPNSFGVLDWGRGVWTYKNTWYWSSVSGKYKDMNIGFNLGYGFGDTSKASENMLFINDEAFKLNDCTFNIPLNNKKEEDYLKTWTITSNDDSDEINLKFVPILDRHDKTNALILSQDAHQVFGKFSGYFKVKNQKFEFEDLMGFAEKVSNKW